MNDDIGRHLLVKLRAENLLREHFKLSRYEARIYLTLIKSQLSIKDISRFSGVPLPRVYDSLATLQEKGFIQDTNDLFEAVSPNAALAGRLSQFRIGFDEEQASRGAALRDIIKIIGSSSSRKSEQQEVSLLRGIQAISTTFVEILSNSVDVFLVAKEALRAKRLFLMYLESAHAGNGKRIRILIPVGTPLSKDEKTSADQMGLEVRVGDGLLLDLMLADEKTVILAVPDRLSDEMYHSVGILIRNESFAKSISGTLEPLWKKSMEV